MQKKNRKTKKAKKEITKKKIPKRKRAMKNKITKKKEQIKKPKVSATPKQIRKQPLQKKLDNNKKGTAEKKPASSESPILQKEKTKPNEYKSLVPPEAKEPEIKATSKERKKLRITEAKIKKMLDVEHLEELFHILNLLNNKQISLFIQHYKNSEIGNSKDKRIDSIIKSAENYHDLLEALKTELASQLSEELERLKTDISDINKGGVDTYIESVKAMSIPLKIRLFLATGKREDFYKVKKMLHTINEALESKRVELKRLEEQKEAREKAFDKAQKQKLEARQEKSERIKIEKKSKQKSMVKKLRKKKAEVKKKKKRKKRS